MGRHSTGAKNNKPAKGLILILVAILVIIALVLLWFFQRDKSESTSNSECSKDSMTLRVATTDKETAQRLIDDFNSQDIEVREYCDVNAEITNNIAEAGLVISSLNHEGIQTLLNQANRSATSSPEEWPSAEASQLGILSTAGEDVLQQPESIHVPVASDAAGSALVAAFVQQNNADATKAMLERDQSLDRDGAVAEQLNVATTQSEAEASTPEGYEFVPLPGLYKNVRTIALAATEQSGEDQARAADAFARNAQNQDQQLPSDAVTAAYEATAWSSIPASALPNTTPAAPSAPSEQAHQDGQAQGENQQVEAQNTLFLLDTSAGFSGAWMDNARSAIPEVARQLSAAGKQVALWNYSSPLTGARDVGWRDNEAFSSSPDGVQSRMQMLITDGQPQTHEALNAAVAQAQAHNARIVLITTGSVDNQPVNLGGVPLSVVFVGAENQADPAVQELANPWIATQDPSQLLSSLQQATGVDTE